MQFPFAKKASAIRKISDRKFLGMAHMLIFVNFCDLSESFFPHKIKKLKTIPTFIIFLYEIFGFRNGDHMSHVKTCIAIVMIDEHREKKRIVYFTR